MVSRVLCRIAIFSAAFFSCWAASAESVRESWPRLNTVLQDTSLPANWRDEDGFSLIYYHLIYGSEARAAQLIGESDLSAPRVEPAGPLLDIAIQVGSQQVVEALLKNGESANALKPVWSRALTSLEYSKAPRRGALYVSP